MFLTRSEYDRGVNTFSPEGRLFQVEYAIEAIKARALLRPAVAARRAPKRTAVAAAQLGSTAIGIQTSAGVVLAVEKRITSPLLDPSSIEKIVEVDGHIACAMSGLTADARTMIDHARSEAQNYRFTYNERIRVESITQSVCDLALRFGEDLDNDDESTMSRPFGVALLIAGVDERGPQLFVGPPFRTASPHALTRAARRAALGSKRIRRAPIRTTTPWPLGVAARVRRQPCRRSIASQ